MGGWIKGERRKPHNVAKASYNPRQHMGGSLVVHDSDVTVWIEITGRKHFEEVNGEILQCVWSSFWINRGREILGLSLPDFQYLIISSFKWEVGRTLLGIYKFMVSALTCLRFLFSPVLRCFPLLDPGNSFADEYFLFIKSVRKWGQQTDVEMGTEGTSFH